MSSTDLEVGEEPERFGSDAQQSKDDASKPSNHRLGVGMPQRDEAEIAFAARLDAISEINRRASPLLRLPAELRNRIFTYALSDRVLVDPAICTVSTAKYYEPDISMHDLPLVCRQLYQETHLLVYRFGLFNIKRPGWFAALISGREDVKKAITEIRISSVDLYLIVLTSHPHWANTSRADFDVPNYQRCFAELRDLSNLQRIVVTHSSVYKCPGMRLSLLGIEVDRPVHVAWAIQQITGRKDVEIILTYTN